MIALRIALIVIIQLAFLAQMIGQRAAILRDGIPILLKTEPIDPRSLFRGDYVVLNYDISSLDIAALEGDNDFERQQDIYVAVEQSGDLWKATGAYHQWPKIVGDQVIMQGRVKWVRASREPCEEDDPFCIDQRLMNSIVRVDYGIDSYFVPEGEGKAIEAAMAEQDAAQRVVVQIAVDENGTSAIKALILDGETLYEENIF